jgi:outer membrane protein assembly factor BamB
LISHPGSLHSLPATTGVRTEHARARRTTTRCVAHCSLGIALCGLALARGLAAEPTSATADWPQWRGPGGRASISATQLADPWPAGPLQRVWHAPLFSGWSSPVVAGGKVFITDRTGATERVLAFDAATGKELWKRETDVEFDPHQVGRKHGRGPKATALVDGDRVYTVGIAGRLACLRTKNGDVIWEVNYPAKFGAREPLADGRAIVNGVENVIVPIGKGIGAPVPLFGYTGSPTLSGKLLITPVGGERAGTIMAFDKLSGEVVWKSLHENVSYSSPVIAEIGGVLQVVVMTGPRVVGLAVNDGKLLWSHPFQISYDESIATPAMAGDLVLVTATGKPLTALRIVRDGATWKKEVAWTNEMLSSYLSSMVVDREFVYGMNDGGEFCCLRLIDGKQQWFGGTHGYYCSPILAGGRLFGLNENGSLAVLSAGGAGYKELGLTQLVKAETWTTPAIVGSRIFIRSGEGIDCFETRP